MGSDYLNFNLEMFNLWIGLCRSAAGLPGDLRRLGYDAVRIEYKFTNSRREVVVPELILSSMPEKHTALLDWKEGANVESDQLDRYSRITPEDLADKAFVPSSAVSLHDVAIIGRMEFVERLKKGIEEGGHAFPLLVVEHDGIVLAANEFSNPSLNEVFTPKLEIDFSQQPTLFVPFDQDSELWVVAERVMPEVLVYMLERRPRVLLAALAQDTVETWTIMGRAHQDRLRSKIKVVLRQASGHEFRKYLRYNRAASSRTRTAVWDIANNPLDLTLDRRSREFRHLQRQQERFIEALRTGKRPPEQLELDLFD